MTLDRRSLLAFFASSGLGHTLLPGVLWAQIQPGTRKLTGVMFTGQLYREGDVIALAKAWQDAAKPVEHPPLFAAAAD